MNNYNPYKAMYHGLTNDALNKLFVSPPPLKPLGATPLKDMAKVNVRYAIRRDDAATPTSLVAYANDGTKEFSIFNEQPEKAALFTSTADLLIALAARAVRVQSYPELLNDRYAIVKVLITETPSTEKVRVAKEGELTTQPLYAIRTNASWFLTRDGSFDNYAQDVEQARTFPTRGLAVRYAVSGKLPTPGGLRDIEFVALTMETTKGTTKYEVVEL